MKPAELKSLTRRSAELSHRKQDLETQIESLRKDLQDISAKKAAVDKQISAAAKISITVSEHALLRYVERAMGLDIGEIENRILTPELRKLIECGGTGKYPIADEGLRAVVKGRTIVTVV